DQKSIMVLAKAAYRGIVRSTKSHPNKILMEKPLTIANEFDVNEQVVLVQQGCLEFLRGVDDHTFQLIVTSPPYNLGKEYEKRLRLEHYVEEQKAIIRECVR